MTWVIEGLRVTDADLLSTNVPEVDAPEWDNATNWAKDAEVQVTSLHRVYRAARANTDSYPPDNLPDPDDETAVFDWIDLGPTNRWRIFEDQLARTAQNADLLEYRFRLPGTVTAVAFHGLIAAEVEVQLDDQAIVRRNLLTYSRSFASNWSAVAGLDVSFADGPRGAGTVAELTSTGNSSVERFVQALDQGAGVYTLALDVDQSLDNEMSIQISGTGLGGGSSVLFSYNPSTDVVGFADPDFDSFELTDLGNGWTRIALTFTADSLAFLDVYPARTSLEVGRIARIAAPQLELASAASEYQYVDDAATFDQAFYSRSETVNDREVVVDPVSWRLYDPKNRSQALFDDLVGMAAHILTIRVKAPGGVAQLARLDFGFNRKLGVPQSGGDLDFEPFTTIDRDPDFGLVTIVQRGYVYRTRLAFYVQLGQELSVVTLVANRFAIPSTYHQGRALVSRGRMIFGLPQPLKVKHEDADPIYCNIDIDGIKHVSTDAN